MLSLLRFALTLVVVLVVGCTTTGGNSASKLIGRWRSQNGPQTAEYDFAANGAFSGTVAAGGRLVADFTGRWSLTAGAILYEYTSDKLGSIPVGTKDHDKLLSIGPDQYVIEAADGSRRTYVRTGS